MDKKMKIEKEIRKHLIDSLKLFFFNSDRTLESLIGIISDNLTYLFYTYAREILPEKYHFGEKPLEPEKFGYIRGYNSAIEEMERRINDLQT